ncbi:MAG: helix-turn-helix domain-containing protein, partial [Ktedonobacterales bacterium]
MRNLPPTLFGVLLKRHRVAALLTQEQLAARAQLSPEAIRALERGKRRTPRLDSVRLLADALALTGPEREALLTAAQRPESAALSKNDPAAPRRAGQPLPLAFAIQANLFLGREMELETIRQRLTGDVGAADTGNTGNQSVERARLLTLTGPAGVGKT